jgi:hypothetical protein
MGAAGSEREAWLWCESCWAFVGWCGRASAGGSGIFMAGGDGLLGRSEREAMQRRDEQQRGELTGFGGTCSFRRRSECWGAKGVTGGAGCRERECGQDRPAALHHAAWTMPRGRCPLRGRRGCLQMAHSRVVAGLAQHCECLDRFKVVGEGHGGDRFLRMCVVSCRK